MKILLPILVVLMASFAAASEGGTGAAAPGVSLPPPPKAGAMSLEEALVHRRSVRAFLPGSLTLDEISRLAWAAQGTTEPGRRTAPSAGATYPLEIYLVVGDVENLSAGVYHYRPVGHRLEALADGQDIRAHLAAASNDQEWVHQAAMVVVITAVFERTTTRYGSRGERYVHMESGHAAQNLLLQAAAMGLGATPVGAFNDTDVSRLLHLPASAKPLYLIPVARGPRQ